MKQPRYSTRLGWFVLLFAVLSSFAPLARAEDLETQGEIMAQLQRLQAEIQRLQAEIDALKRKQEAGTRIPAPPTPNTPTATLATVSSAQDSAGASPQQAPTTKLPEWLGRTSFSGTAYLRYSRELERGARDANRFDLDRIYFVLWSQLTDRVRLRLTMEAGEKRDSAGYFDVATKHFFLEVTKFPFASSRFLAGLADLPWVPYEEAVWGYRFQGTVFPDREGYLTSTDLGVNWRMDLPRKRGDLHLSVVNGEGWAKPEIGKYKDVHLRFTLSPFRAGWAKDVFLGAFGSTGNYDGVAAGQPRKRQRAILQGGYRGTHLRLMGSYLWADDPASAMQGKHPSLAARAGQLAQARGFSLFAVFNLGLFSPQAEKWELIARHDRLDPDQFIPNNSHQRWILGGSYRWNPHVQTLLDYERLRADSGALRPFERRLMLQNEIRF